MNVTMKTPKELKANSNFAKGVHRLALIEGQKEKRKTKRRDIMQKWIWIPTLFSCAVGIAIQCVYCLGRIWGA